MAVPILREKEVKFSNQYLHGHSSKSPNHPLYKGVDKWVLKNQGKHFCQCSACVKKGSCKETEIKILSRHYGKRGIPRLKAGHYQVKDFRKGMKDSEAVCQQRAASVRLAWANDPTYRKRVAEASRRNMGNWHNKFHRRPTGPELFLSGLLPDWIRYVGDGSFYCWIPSLKKNRNPDFKVSGKSKVIELFGDYWHRDDNPEDFIRQYAEAGFECLVIWEKDLMLDPMSVLERCLDFALPIPSNVSVI